MRDKAVARRLCLIDSNGRFRFDNLIQPKFYNKETGKFNPILGELIDGDGTKDLKTELSIVEKFAHSGVGYEFTLTTTENNNASMGALIFDFPLSVGAARLGLGGTLNRERQNERTIKLAETIENIVFDKDLMKLKICNEHDFNRREDYIYPITGRINLLDSFSTYAGLVLKAGLGDEGQIKGFKDKSALGKISSQDLTDVILFTTTVDGSANPSVTLDPLRTSANLTSGSIGLSNRRIDRHQLRLIIQEQNVAEILNKLEIESFRDDGITFFGAN